MKDRDELEYFLRLVGEQSTEHAFILLDLNGRVQWWNSGAEQIFGRSAVEMLNEPMTRLFTPDDIQKGIPEQEIAMAREVGKAEDDRWLVRSDGSRFWATGIMVSIQDDDNQTIGFAKILRNRTDVKEQLEFFRNQIEELSKENERKSIFLATLAHEL